MIKRQHSILGRILSDAQALDTYDVGVTTKRLALLLGFEPSNILKLNSNENYFINLNFLRRTIKDVVNEVDPRIYPRDETKELKIELSQHLKVELDEIIIGSGSDQLIDVVSRILLRPSDIALAISPTFSIYKRCVEIQGARYRKVPLRSDFSLNVDQMLESVNSDTRLIFLCSPNNPTGNQFSVESVKHLADNFEGLVAVDEAYADFSDFSIIDLARNSENIIVFRTFSKVFGLAGLRVGYAITNTNFAKTLDQRFQMPYSVSLVALKTAKKLLQNMDIVEAAIENVKCERMKLIDQFNKMDGVHAFNSQANFVLFQVNTSAYKIYESLLRKGIIIRKIGQVLDFDNCLRVTVAPQPMMEKFLNVFKEVVT